MAERANGRDALLSGIHVIDGGLASELEYLGARIDGPLWSAHVLEDEPEKVAAVHRAYIAAGSQCVATCSYQVSRMGYAEVGLTAERADAALLRSVELARSVVAEFPGRRVLVAGSLGPYGAALHNGGEYTQATTSAPMPTWSGFTASGLKSLLELLARNGPIYWLSKLSHRWKKYAP